MDYKKLNKKYINHLLDTRNIKELNELYSKFPGKATEIVIEINEEETNKKNMKFLIEENFEGLDTIIQESNELKVYGMIKANPTIMENDKFREKIIELFESSGMYKRIDDSILSMNYEDYDKFRMSLTSTMPTISMIPGILYEVEEYYKSKIDNTEWVPTEEDFKINPTMFILLNSELRNKIIENNPELIVYIRDASTGLINKAIKHGYEPSEKDLNKIVNIKKSELGMKKLCKKNIDLILEDRTNSEELYKAYFNSEGFDRMTAIRECPELIVYAETVEDEKNIELYKEYLKTISSEIDEKSFEIDKYTTKEELKEWLTRTKKYLDNPEKVEEGKYQMPIKELMTVIKSFSEHPDSHSKFEEFFKSNGKYSEKFGKEIEKLYFDENLVLGCHGTVTKKTKDYFENGIIKSQGGDYPEIGTHIALQYDKGREYRSNVVEPMLLSKIFSYGSLKYPTAFLVAIPKDGIFPNENSERNISIYEEYYENLKKKYSLNPKYIYGYFEYGEDNKEVAKNENYDPYKEDDSSKKYIREIYLEEAIKNDGIYPRSKEITKTQNLFKNLINKQKEKIIESTEGKQEEKSIENTERKQEKTGTKCCDKELAKHIIKTKIKKNIFSILDIGKATINTKTAEKVKAQKVKNVLLEKKKKMEGKDIND